MTTRNDSTVSTTKASRRNNALDGLPANLSYSAIDASAQDWLGSNQDPDVLLSVPDLGVDKITLAVDDLAADVDLHARVLDFFELRVGAHVTLAKVDLDIENVRAQAMLKVKLDQVVGVIDRVMKALESNPEIIGSVLPSVDVGSGRLNTGVPRKAPPKQQPTRGRRRASD